MEESKFYWKRGNDYIPIPAKDMQVVSAVKLLKDAYYFVDDKYVRCLSVKDLYPEYRDRMHMDMILVSCI